MKLVIGIVGPPLAGKETCAGELEALLKRDGFSVSRHRFSDILRETLTLWGIPHGRENEQLLPQVMNAPSAFKEGALSRAVKNRLMKNPADVGILDGARWREDEKMIRELGREGIKNVIIYIAASPERRYERLKMRDRAGEAAISWETFLKQERVATETSIPDIGSRADVKLVNDRETTDEFLKAISEAYRAKIKPLL